MTKIYLVRHAQAEGNLYRRAHGMMAKLRYPQGHAQIAGAAAPLCRHPGGCRVFQSAAAHPDHGGGHL